MASKNRPPREAAPAAAIEPASSPLAIIIVGIVLIILALVNIGLAFLPLLPGLAVIVALLIALIMAYLIAVFFMRLRFGTSVQRLTFFAGFVTLAILLAGVISDYLTRGWLPVPGK